MPEPGRREPPDRGCTAPGGRDFPKVGGNLGNQNFTSLDRIGHHNIHRLGGAWLNRQAVSQDKKVRFGSHKRDRELLL